MVKTCLRLALIALLGLSCASKPYDYLHGQPRLDVRHNVRIAMVGKPYHLGVTLTGQMPAPNQDVMVVVKIDGDTRLTSVGTMGSSRMIPGPSRRFTINFTELDYFQATGRLQGNSFGDTHLTPLSEMTQIDPMNDDSGWLYIDVELWLADPHPYKPNDWVRVKRYAFGKFKVQISCPHCVY
jgi:hypothetical protein